MQEFSHEMHHICRACGKEISPLPLPAICVCGWMDTSHSEKEESLRLKHLIIGGVAFAVVFVIGVSHLFTWGGDAFSIMRLKTQKAIGLIGSSGLESIVEICTRRGKFECASNAYIDLIRREPKNLDRLQQFAHFNFRLKHYSTASQSYEAYIQSGGREYEALNEYALALALQGQKEKAVQLYREALNVADSTILPVKAITGLVRLLIDETKYEEAKQVLNSFYKNASNAPSYLGEEFSLLQKLMKEKSRAAKTLSVHQSKNQPKNQTVASLDKHRTSARPKVIKQIAPADASPADLPIPQKETVTSDERIARDLPPRRSRAVITDSQALSHENDVRADSSESEVHDERAAPDAASRAVAQSDASDEVNAAFIDSSDSSQDRNLP